MTRTERSVENILTEADDVDDPLSPSLSLSTHRGDAIDFNGGKIDADDLIKIIDGLKSSSTIVKFDSNYSTVVQEGFKKNSSYSAVV